ncbi:MAG: NHL repeat-containing protein, partial [Desulfobulbaceae bacterium]|nr:NHL repeat-containing protein [Desulfobulbaceae bacterium]
ISVSVVLLCLSMTTIPVKAANGEGQRAIVKVVAILNADELGESFRYPSFLAYDQDMDEIYVTVGGKGKIIVYNSNFFPTDSLGPGRGADAARGIYLNNDGWIYVCQGETDTRPGQVTVFNPAFFPEQEIIFDSIPGVEKFLPRDLVIGLTGNIYVVGQGNRGLMVLDKEGKFSHWLQPQDQIFDMEAAASAQEEREQNELELTDIGMITREKTEIQDETLDMSEFLPQELIPGSIVDRLKERKSSLGPVIVADVARDSEGHLYVLSEETGKVYVYSPFEEFLFSFGEKGGSPGKMSRPKSLVVDEKKKAVYVVDYMRHTILIFDQGGKFMYEFGGFGTGPGWFQYPTGLTLTRDGLLAVADLFNHRVQVLDVQFEYKFPLFQSPETGKPEIRDDIQPEQSTPPDSGTDDGGDIFQPAPL